MAFYFESKRMKTLTVFAAVASLAGLSLAAETSTALPRSSPEEQGVSSAALLEFVKAADRKIDGMHSVIVVRHGHVVAEGWWSPYDAGSPHSLFSLSKSFTSTAVGLAYRGRVAVRRPGTRVKLVNSRTNVLQAPCRSRW